MPKPRLWIVSELYYPEMTSTGYYVTTIAEGLASDREVKIICGQPNYSSRGTVAPKHEIRNGVEIFRVMSTRLDKNRVLNRVVNMITLGASTFWYALRRFNRGDHVMVVTTPPSLPFNTALAAMLKGSAYTLLVHDAYPEQLIAVGAVSARSPLVRSLHFANRWLYKHASKIIVVGRDMKALLEQKTHGLDIPVVCIPNWAELEQVRPESREGNLLLAKLGLEDKFVILSAGNIGRPTDIETVVNCADQLRAEPDIHFLFVGDGAKLPWLTAEVERRSLSNITFVGPMPREKQTVFLNACDIGLVTLVPGMLGAAVPSRLYNILAAEKPVLALADEGSEVATVIQEENVGWVDSSRDPRRLKELILMIVSQRQDLPAMGKRARAAAEAKYSPEIAIEAYRETLQ
ncbi:MAG: glycosyltransferase family 4 protein [Acidobacteria bacterium]|nr:glycosyltransferase family 4 protein [Acidobacteriota bacterium]